MKQTEPQSRNESILKQLAELEAMPTEKLKERWRELNQTDPPRFSRQFMIKRMAHRIQELAFGGPSENNRKLMNRLLDDEGYDELGVKSRPRAMKRGDAFLPGTLLVKEWKGERHEVITLSDGTFEHRGLPYRSLSAVTRAITGTNWNGPKFFGLRDGVRAEVREADEPR